ncbi:hypothetical protein FJTKL_11559 [Diaporthe vaccinii]|uniref:Uncharacterized protein n=1 Tax=Diaporthe vaccinii TaxID=105482 RepID=A0ABR4EG05_9PEZI
MVSAMPSFSPSENEVTSSSESLPSTRNEIIQNGVRRPPGPQMCPSRRRLSQKTARATANGSFRPDPTFELRRDASRRALQADSFLHTAASSTPRTRSPSTSAPTRLPTEPTPASGES